MDGPPIDYALIGAVQASERQRFSVRAPVQTAHREYAVYTQVRAGSAQSGNEENPCESGATEGRQHRESGACGVPSRAAVLLARTVVRQAYGIGGPDRLYI